MGGGSPGGSGGGGDGVGGGGTLSPVWGGGAAGGNGLFEDDGRANASALPKRRYCRGPAAPSVTAASTALSTETCFQPEAPFGSKRCTAPAHGMEEAVPEGYWRLVPKTFAHGAPTARSSRLGEMSMASPKPAPSPPLTPPAPPAALAKAVRPSSVKSIGTVGG